MRRVSGYQTLFDARPVAFLYGWHAKRLTDMLGLPVSKSVSGGSSKMHCFTYLCRQLVLVALAYALA
jgi:hypothetical protein